MPPSPNEIVASHVYLELGGSIAGPVRTVEGGNMFASVLTDTPTRQHFLTKRVGEVQVEDFVVQLGMGMDKPWSDWIAKMWSGDLIPLDGRVLLADRARRVLSSQVFTAARLREVTFPGLDTTSREYGMLQVKFSPESVRRVDTSGELVSASSTSRKPWVTSRFRLEMEGLECKSVRAIHEFTLRARTAPRNAFDPSGATNPACRIEVPDLAVNIPVSESDSWMKWFDDFVVRGNHGRNRLKNGSIVLLAEDNRTELGRIGLFNVGIFKFARLPSGASTAQPPQMVAELYCERMEFFWSSRP
jgi:hypothetical protein